MYAHAVDGRENLTTVKIDYHAGRCDAVEIGPRPRRAFPGLEPALRNAHGGGATVGSRRGGIEGAKRGDAAVFAPRGGRFNRADRSLAPRAAERGEVDAQPHRSRS